MFEQMNPLAIILWAVLLGSLVFVLVLKIIGKIKYKGVDMPIDEAWLANSINLYPNDDTFHQYYFHYDKHFTAQGHVMEDINHQVVYEGKFLYNNAFGKDEVDFINHIINYGSHHKIGHTVTNSVGSGNISITTSSSFSFDGVDVYDYLHNLGYSYHLNVLGLAYTVDISRDGKHVGKFYSSNNGKNFFEADGPIVPKMGGNGLMVVETDYQNLDAVFLLAIAFTRTDISVGNDF